MSRRSCFYAALVIILALAIPVFCHAQERPAGTRQITGTIVSLANKASILVKHKDGRKTPASIRFKITSKTKIMGELAVGRQVRIIFNRKRIHKRVKREALIIEVIQDQGMRGRVLKQ
jgi:hypothetical protein